MMKRSGVSTSIAVALLIVGLLVGSLAVYAYTASTATTSTATSTVVSTTTSTVGGATATSTSTITSTVTSTVQQGSPQLSPVFLANLAGISPLCKTGGNFSIGVLTDLTSSLSYEGVRTVAATKMATSDVNAELRAIGCGKVSFNTKVEDYALSSTTAENDLNTFAAAGVDVVVGPLNSGAAISILPTANSDHIVLISPSSTAVSLAIPNDYLFRTAPSDTGQAKADARELTSQGITAIVVAHIHDTYGDGLANATVSDFQALGGHVINSGFNNFFNWPDPCSPCDFSTQLPTMDSDIKSAVSTYGASHVAFYVVGFDEVGQLLAQAKQGGYTNLLGVTWYGSDGTATATTISSDTTDGPIGASVGLVSTEYAAFNSSLLVSFTTRFQALGSAYVADGYATGSYDDAWLAMETILYAGTYSGPAIQQNIGTVGANLYGVTGWLGLDANGDRLPTSGYDIWEIVTTGCTGGVPACWIMIGHWSLPDSPTAITWTKAPTVP